jgi:ATP phosphoribosyltransferase
MIFDAVATNFRRENGYRLRIATKYQNLIWAYLRKMGVADYQLIDSQGATEGVIKSNSAEAVADITSSGETLKANHLKIIGQEPVLRSQATLFLSSKNKLNEKQYETLISLCQKISTVIPKQYS